MRSPPQTNTLTVLHFLFKKYCAKLHTNRDAYKLLLDKSRHKTTIRRQLTLERLQKAKTTETNKQFSKQNQTKRHKRRKTGATQPYRKREIACHLAPKPTFCCPRDAR
jgi:hypothetical protein